MRGRLSRLAFSLLLLGLVVWPSSAQDTQQTSSESSRPTRTLKIPPGLSIDPNLSDLAQTLLLLRRAQLEQNEASRMQIDDLKSTGPKLDESSNAVSSSLTTASTEASQTSSSLTDASTTLSDTSKASTVYDASVDKLEANLKAEVLELKSRLIWCGLGGAAVGAVVIGATWLLVGR